MKQVSGYLDDVKSAISVSEISAVGTRTNCRFSAVSDADGAYEIKLRDTSGKIPCQGEDARRRIQGGDISKDG
jgi:hypothetical protein